MLCYLANSDCDYSYSYSIRPLRPSPFHSYILVSLSLKFFALSCKVVVYRCCHLNCFTVWVNPVPMILDYSCANLTISRISVSSPLLWTFPNMHLGAWYYLVYWDMILLLNLFTWVPGRCSLKSFCKDIFVLSSLHRPTFHF